MSFVNWLKTQQKQRGSIGDLARDLSMDTTLPAEARTIRGFLIYLKDCNACDGAIKAYHAALKQYRARAV